MLSNHYPLAFGTAYNWVIAALVFLMGVTIRHWFNTTHARKGRPTWTWIVTVVLFILIIWLSTVPKQLAGGTGAETVAPAFRQFTGDPHFPAVRQLVSTRCSMCHSAEPVYEGIARPPKGVVLENDAEIAAHAREIYIQAGRSHAMPPGNVTDITPDERRLIVAWFESAVEGRQE
jgi:uncharacterized membrane protein